jgi:hypothetical protein
MRCVVSFYREVFGVPFEIARGSIPIASARSEARAIEAAKRKFARRHGVTEWTLLADGFDCFQSSDAPHNT